MNDFISNEHAQAFESRMVSLLGDRLYNLDRPQDRRDVSKSMILAYRETVDPYIIQKLQHLHYNVGVALNPHFINEVVNYIKTTLT
jgi:hypothetical protein